MDEQESQLKNDDYETENFDDVVDISKKKRRIKLKKKTGLIQTLKNKSKKLFGEKKLKKKSEKMRAKPS